MLKNGKKGHLHRQTMDTVLYFTVPQHTLIGNTFNCYSESIHSNLTISERRNSILSYPVPIYFIAIL